MQVTITAQRNPALVWDVAVVVKADAGEGISDLEVLINGFSRLNENFNPPASQWQKTLIQEGVYPGDNKAEVRVTDSKGKQTTWYDEWS